MYEGDKRKLHDSIFEVVKAIVPPEIGLLYRWESEDLAVSKSVQAMTALELRDFISPAITILHAQQRIVFGLRMVSSPHQENGYAHRSQRQFSRHNKLKYLFPTRRALVEKWLQQVTSS
jgi:hypothetical protein